MATGERPGGLDAGGPAAHDNDVDRRSGGTGRGCLLKRAQQVPAQPHRVGQRVQRPSVFAHARDAEEVRLGAGGHDQVVEAERGTVLEHECAARVVQPGRLADAHAYVGLPAEDRVERGADFFRRQVTGADLVEQRLDVL
jgi:hypothetical protein